MYRWNGAAIDFVLAGVESVNVEKEYPSVYKSVYPLLCVCTRADIPCRWHKKLTQRSAVARLLEIRNQHMKAHSQASK